MTSYERLATMGRAAMGRVVGQGKPPNGDWVQLIGPHQWKLPWERYPTTRGEERGEVSMAVRRERQGEMSFIPLPLYPRMVWRLEMYDMARVRIKRVRPTGPNGLPLSVLWYLKT